MVESDSRYLRDKVSSPFVGEILHLSYHRVRQIFCDEILCSVG